jgi:hypothetical protein
MAQGVTRTAPAGLEDPSDFPRDRRTLNTRWPSPASARRGHAGGTSWQTSLPVSSRVLLSTSRNGALGVEQSALSQGLSGANSGDPEASGSNGATLLDPQDLPAATSPPDSLIRPSCQ